MRGGATGGNAGVVVGATIGPGVDWLPFPLAAVLWWLPVVEAAVEDGKLTKKLCPGFIPWGIVALTVLLPSGAATCIVCPASIPGGITTEAKEH